MNNRACNVARADLQKIMALKRAILALPTGYLEAHPITKYDALSTSVQKKSGHSEQLDHASLTRPLFFHRPAKNISGLARETT